MKKIVLIIFIIAVISSCGHNKPDQPAVILPYDAIQKAAAAAESRSTVKGIFSLKVKAFGNQGASWYLNSELDYRDQRNLTIAIAQNVKAELVTKYGKNLESIFKGKNILVEGEAKRVKIAIYANGIKMSKYYYQTHVRVNNIHKIEFQ